MKVVLEVFGAVTLLGLVIGGVLYEVVKEEVRHQP
jgi:hypothetical protein